MEEIADEGIVLLENQDNLLPLEANSNINVFGWSSTNPVYGGTGSGALNDAYHIVSLLEGLANAGFKANTELSDFYTAYRDDRPKVGMFAQDFPAGSHYLELSQSEANMVDLVCSNFDNVVVICNSFNSLGRILNGTVNPSGKAADTFIRNFTQAPYWNNFGLNVYDNMTEFQISEDNPYVPGTMPHFVNYVEDIYVG